MDISVVIPIYNEADNILPLTQRLRAVMQQMNLSYEFIFINDGSKDNSLAVIKTLASTATSIKYLDLSRNFGHQIAVMAGLDEALGKAVVIIDADLQDPPELILDLYQKMQEGYEVVYAKRKKRKGESTAKRWTAHLFYRFLSSITPIDIPLDTGDFRIIDQKVVKILRQMPEQNKYLRGQIAWIGFNQSFVSYERQHRNAGDTGYTFSKMLRLAWDAVTGFSNFPLKVVSYFGFITSIIAFLVMLFTLYSRLVLKAATVPGWASLMISVLFIGGVQMIAIGIIGEYLSRVNQNVRNRPLYIVKDSNIEEKP
ncbi:MAG: glycosyltransferase family 2 protein [Saprospiraceae bacterium]